MRAFFALLALVNLALLMTFSSGGPADDAGDYVDLRRDAQELLLISELPLAERPGPRTTLSRSSIPDEVRVVPDRAAVNAPPVATRSCYRLEGFPDPQALKAAKSRLRTLGVRLKNSGEASFERRRYWVVLPRFRSREHAAPVMARLRAAGISDFYFVPGGEDKNTLSLGLFSTAEAAQRRMAQLAPLKLKVHTREVVSPAKRYFLDVTWEKSPAALVQGLRLPEAHEVRVQGCPASQ